MSSRERAPKKKPRHKIALEPISMDEILAGPGMSGFVSILDPPEQVPHLQALVDDIKDIPLPALSKERLKSAGKGPSGASGERQVRLSIVPPPESRPEPVDSPQGVGDSAASSGPRAPGGSYPAAAAPPALDEEPAGLFPDGTAEPDETAADWEAGGRKGPGVERDTPPALPQTAILQGRHLRRAVLAQDGHSAGEEMLYQALWNSRYARTDSKETRLVTIGWKAMAKLARLTPRNTKRNCQSLIAKLAMEQLSDENSRESIGRTYRLYSYKAILERRKAAGFEWVMRSRGVAFVEAPPAPAPEPPVRILVGPGRGRRRDWSVPATLPGMLPEPPSGVPGSRKGSGVERDTPPKPPPGPPLAAIVAALREYLADVDDASAAALAAACREHTPDATDEEIAHFVRLKADLIQRMGNVKSPMGFLRTAVPRCFEGESFRQFREAEEQRRETASLRQLERESGLRRLREEQRAILEDPASSEEDRRLARGFLENS